MLRYIFSSKFTAVDLLAIGTLSQIARANQWDWYWEISATCLALCLTTLIEVLVTRK